MSPTGYSVQNHAILSHVRNMSLVMSYCSYVGENNTQYSTEVYVQGSGKKRESFTGVMQYRTVLCCWCMDHFVVAIAFRLCVLGPGSASKRALCWRIWEP